MKKYFKYRFKLNSSGSFATLVAALAVAACGGGGGGAETPSPPVPQVFSANKTSTCLGGTVITGTGTGASQTAADSAAQVVLDTKYPSTCPAGVITNAKAEVVGGVTKITGWPAGLTVLGGTGTLTAGTATQKVKVSADGTLTREDGSALAWATAHSGPVAFTFANAGTATVAVSFTSQKVIDIVPASSRDARGVTNTVVKDLGDCTGKVMDPCFVAFLKDGTVRVADTGMTLTGYSTREVKFYVYSVNKVGSFVCWVPFFTDDGSTVSRQAGDTNNYTYGDCNTDVVGYTRGTAAGMLTYTPRIDKCFEKV